MTINIILFNSSLELAKNLGSKRLKHAVFVNDKKRRKKNRVGDLLLDISVHYSGMTPEERINRGRPDIVHQIILQYHFSTINHNPAIENQSDKIIKLFIHTIQNNVFEVPPEWRIPVSYLRFRGLMEKFLLNKELEKPEIHLKQMTIEELLQEIKPEMTYLWSEDGEKANLNDFKILNKEKNIAWLIGGYQSGEIPMKIIKLADKKLKIFNQVLPSWKVLGTLLTNIELNNYI